MRGVHLFQEAQAIISANNSLRKAIRGVDDKIAQHQLETPKATWEKDRADIEEALTCGRDLGEYLVELNLKSHNEVVPAPARCKDAGIDRVVQGMFEESSKSVNGETWGVVAERQLKGWMQLEGIISRGQYR